MSKWFWQRVNKTDTCWLWTAALNRAGYGVVWVVKKLRRAHVVSWEMEFGPVPEGKELDHLCRTRSCVRPSHLEAVSHRENIMRGASPSARRAGAAACEYGHEFDERNTYITPAGHRQCRKCRARRQLEYVQRRKGRDHGLVQS